MNTLTQQQINQYQWRVADGVAKPVNLFKNYNDKVEFKWYLQEEAKIKDISAFTNAPDGTYSGEAFEVEYQGLYESGWFKISELVYQNYIANPIDLLVEDVRLFLRLKPSHLPAVLTTQPGEEWKDRYNEVWYVQERGSVNWTKVTRRAIYDNYTFERYAALQFDKQDQATKREWHLITPPAEQEAETVYPNQALFDYMSQEHGLTLTQSEMAEIIHIVAQSALTQKDQRIAELERERDMHKTIVQSCLSVFEYVLENNDGVGVCLGYQADSIMESMIKKIKALPIPPQH